MPESSLKPDRQKTELVEGEDYYLEQGRYVFTESFLKKRGYCCQSGCRHCPYGFRKPVLPVKNRRKSP